MIIGCIKKFIEFESACDELGKACRESVYDERCKIAAYELLHNRIMAGETLSEVEAELKTIREKLESIRDR